MTEPRLEADLTGRFDRLLWATLAGYAALVVLAFTVVSETSLRRSLEQSADGIESLLGLYVDTATARNTVAPAMLADQLLGMGDRFLITRTVSTGDGRIDPSVYFLSPTMPAKRIETGPGMSAEAVRQTLLESIAARGRWRFHVFHRRSGEFDIYVAGSRRPYLVAVLGLSLGALFLLPIAALWARREANRAVERALAPLGRVVRETQAIGPSALSRRVGTPTGLAEVTGLAEAINRMIDRVERSHRALEAFTADASHELRTPLTHLRAQVQWALAEHRAPADIHEALTATGREVDRMSRMVEDMLLIARGENRQLAIERQAFDLEAVAQEVKEITADMTPTSTITVSLDVDGLQGLQAVGDPARVRQILLNLASNAVRYTKEGAITFTLAHRDGLAGVRVRDTGCGIPPEQIDRVFDRFYRVESSRSRAHGGSGLGLTIAQVLAELQDGRIEVESRPGHGSTFSLWLPCPPLERR